MRNSYLTIFLLINGVWLVFFSVFYLLFFEPEFTWAIDDIANVIFVVAIYGKKEHLYAERAKKSNKPKLKVSN